jgi:hypothetical protein
MKVESKDYPLEIEKIQGYTLVNYNIKEATRVDMDGSESKYYTYNQLKLAQNASEEEITKAINTKQVEKAKQYLQETDYKVLPDYDGDTNGVLEARAEARALIRQLEG